MRGYPSHRSPTSNLVAFCEKYCFQIQKDLSPEPLAIESQLIRSESFSLEEKNKEKFQEIFRSIIENIKMQKKSFARGSVEVTCEYVTFIHKVDEYGVNPETGSFLCKMHRKMKRQKPTKTK